MRSAANSRTGLFEGAGEHYGEIWYELAGRRAMNRSTTVPIVIEQLYQLAQLPVPAALDEPDFPGYPLMPGVLIVEAMAQVGGIVLTHLPEYTSLPAAVRALFVFTGIDKVRFRRQVVPGDQLIMTVELLAFKRGRFATMKAKAEVVEKYRGLGDAPGLRNPIYAAMEQLTTSSDGFQSVLCTWAR